MDYIFLFVRENITTVFWILFIGIFGKIFLNGISNRIIKFADDGNPNYNSGREKRAKTLAGLVVTTGNVFLFLFFSILVLRLFGIDATPILAGASVLGFAIGFGSQAIIKDFLAGIFIFIDNQCAVGDHVKIGQVDGIVHDVTMRLTVVRDFEGNIVFIPNGTITQLVNYSLGQYFEKRKKTVMKKKV